MAELTQKQNDILDKAEDVIQKKLAHYLEAQTDMTDKDIYNLHQMVITMGRIQAIRDGKASVYVP